MVGQETSLECRSDSGRGQWEIFSPTGVTVGQWEGDKRDRSIPNSRRRIDHQIIDRRVDFLLKFFRPQKGMTGSDKGLLSVTNPISHTSYL